MEAVIRFEALSKTYRSGDVEVHAVRAVSYEVQAGEFVAKFCDFHDKSFPGRDVSLSVSMLHPVQESVSH